VTKSEEAFQKWLDSNSYSYLFVEQSPETYARAFRDKGKRPDFLILLNRVGVIAADVKEKKPSANMGHFILDEDREVRKSLEFEKAFKLPSWFVFGNPDDHYRTWSWISLHSVLNCPVRTNSNKEKFRAISPSATIVIQANRDSISRIVQ